MLLPSRSASKNLLSPTLFIGEINNTFTALSILETPTLKQHKKNKPSFAIKRHVVLLKTSRRFQQNNTSFFHKYALVFSRTSASFFRPYKMGPHIGSDGKHKKQTHNAQSVNDLFATINSCH